MEHENEHLDIREKLLRLPKLQADENFLKRLQIQIDVLDSEERTRDVVVRGSASGFFKNLFGARLVPALGISSVVVAAFLVYFVLADKKDAVVNNMTSNKTQTTITTEKPSVNTPAPTTENKEFAKKEDNDTKEKPVVKDQETFGNTERKADPKVTSENNFSQPIVKSKTQEEALDERGGQINVRGRTNQQSSTIDEKTSTATAEEKTKISDKSPAPELKQDITKTETTTKNQEKSINEGGRGAPDAKKPQSSIKPKKKDVNSNIDINKSVLESLRDKLK